MTYGQKITPLLSPAERRLLDRLHTPEKIQTYLDRLPINFELEGETIFSPREVMAKRTAHCAEGALFAAAALAYHGHTPLLMDFQTASYDDDHVVAVFKRGGLWGAISQTNHLILRWRDPIYKTPRELAMSYAHEYYLENRRKTLKAFSARPFDLRRYNPRWIVGEGDLEQIICDLDDAPHSPLAPKEVLRTLRPVTKVEVRGLDLTEWPDPRFPD